MSAPQRASSAEEGFFFRLGGEKLFGFLHLPQGTPRAGIVFCHALAEEKLWSHRVYVTFAREAAAAGYAVMRFDVRGEGDSDRDFEESSVQTRVEDTLRAVELLREKVAGLQNVALVGHRLGGNVAAAALDRSEHLAQALVVWDPILRPDEYLLQLLRSNLTTQMATEGKVIRNREALLAAALNGETVVVDGYGLTRALVQGLQALKWSDLANAQSKPALFVELARAEDAPPVDMSPLASERWANLKRTSVQEPPFWRETREFHRRAAQFTSTTLEWLGGLR